MVPFHAPIIASLLLKMAPRMARIIPAITPVTTPSNNVDRLPQQLCQPSHQVFLGPVALDAVAA